NSQGLPVPGPVGSVPGATGRLIAGALLPDPPITNSVVPANRPTTCAVIQLAGMTLRVRPFTRLRCLMDRHILRFHRIALTVVRPTLRNQKLIDLHFFSSPFP